MDSENIAQYNACVNSDGHHCVDGPGTGFGYYAGKLFPQMTLSTQRDAHAAALIANEAYRMGIVKAQLDMRIAMGVKQ